MSTAGKVLVILILLLIPVWVILMSGVAEYNRKGTLGVQKLEQQAAKAEEDIKTAKAATVAMKDDLNLEQVSTSRELAVIQDMKFAVQKRQSDAIDAASRANYALEEQQKAVKTAEMNRDHRIAENKQTQTELTATEEEVERLKQVNRQQMDQLKKLRDEFAKIYNANKMKVVKQAQ